MLNNLFDLRKKNFTKKRVGRGIGTGKGKTSGRGHKGQKSRSGVSLKGFEGGQTPIHRRLPKRGFKNIFKNKFNIINLFKIQSLIDKKIININEEINTKTLIKRNIITKELKGIKILGSGEIKSKIKIQAIKISKSALKKIEKVGGKVELVTTKEKHNITTPISNKKKIENKDKKNKTS